MVIAQENFRDEELAEPKAVLQRNGVSVTVASAEKRTAVGKLGAVVQPDAALADINAGDFDAVVFVGGGGAEQYFDDPAALGLAGAAFDAGKVVAAICIAPVILARAGLLKGKRATVFPDGSDAISAGGAQYTGRPVEVDGKIITANGPESAEAFGMALVKALSV
jgi:protease I